MEIIKGQSISVTLNSDTDLTDYTAEIYAFSYPSKTEIVPSTIVKGAFSITCFWDSTQTDSVPSGMLNILLKLSKAGKTFIGRASIGALVSPKSAIENTESGNAHITINLENSTVVFDIKIGTEIITLLNQTVETIARPARNNVNFVFEGNSRTADIRNYYAPPAEQVTMESLNRRSYPKYLMEMSNFKNRGNYYNYGDYGRVNGGTAGGVYGILTVEKYNRDIKQHRPEANGGQAGIVESYLFIMTGILDMANTPGNVDTEIANYKAYVDRATADGFKVVILTEYYGRGTTYSDTSEKARLKYNNAMLAYAPNVHMVIDTDCIIGFDIYDIWHQQTGTDFYFHASKQGNYLIADFVNRMFNVGSQPKAPTVNGAVKFPDLFTKVDKVAGKGLSTNDYTTAEKNKLAALPSDISNFDVSSKLDKIPALNSTYGGGYVAAVSVEDAEVVVLLTQETSINDCMSEFWDDAVGYQYDGWVLPSQNQGFLLLNSGFVLGDLIKFWTPSEDGVNALSIYHDSGNIDGSWMLKSTYARVLLVKQLTFKRYDYSDKVSGIAVGEGLAINNSNPKLPVITLTGTPGGGEPAIPKSTGLLSWTGTAWAWITNNFLSKTAKITTANVESAVDLKHTHTNKNILDSIQEALTTALKTSYDGAVSWINNYSQNLLNHMTNTSNPHSVTAAQVGTDAAGTPRPASDVYSWAKLPTKPSYTYNEVGASPALMPYVEKTASFTLANTDSDKWLNCNHASTPIVITVPTGLTDGKQFFVFQRGSAAVSVVAGSGMTALATKLSANAQYSAFQISIEGTNFKVIGETKA